MKAILLTLLIAAGAVLADEAAGWGPLTFGMNAAQVRAALPQLQAGKDGALRIKGFDYRTSAPAPSSPWSLICLFTAGTLSRVSLTVIPADSRNRALVRGELDDAKARLNGKYGRPVTDETQGSRLKTIWQTPRAIITLSYLAELNMGTIVYDPPTGAAGL